MSENTRTWRYYLRETWGLNDGSPPVMVGLMVIVSLILAPVFIPIYLILFGIGRMAERALD